MNLTRTFSNQLDIQRRLFLGRKSKLSLVDHDEDNGGYRVVASVRNGWIVTDESEGEAEGGGQLKLEICESKQVTAEVLRTVIGVNLFQSGWVAPRACKIVSRQEPLGEFDRTWVMFITPTSELGVINE